MTALGVEWVGRQPGSFRAIASELSVKDINRVLRQLESTSEAQRSEKANPTRAEEGRWQEEAELRIRMEHRTVRWMWKGQVSYTC